MTKHFAAAFACMLALLAAMPAQAKGGKHHFHWKRHVFVYAAPVYVGPSCGHYYAKWQYTGSHFWKKQYYICKGWW